MEDGEIAAVGAERINRAGIIAAAAGGDAVERVAVVDQPDRRRVGIGKAGEMINDRVARAVRVQLEHRAGTVAAALRRRAVERCADQQQTSAWLAAVHAVREVTQHGVVCAVRVNFENRAAVVGTADQRSAIQRITAQHQAGHRLLGVRAVRELPENGVARAVRADFENRSVIIREAALIRRAIQRAAAQQQFIRRRAIGLVGEIVNHRVVRAVRSHGINRAAIGGTALPRRAKQHRPACHQSDRQPAVGGRAVEKIQVREDRLGGGRQGCAEHGQGNSTLEPLADFFHQIFSCNAARLKIIAGKIPLMAGVGKPVSEGCKVVGAARHCPDR